MMKKSKGILAVLVFCMVICFVGTTAQAADQNGVDWDKLIEVPEEAAKQEANPENRMAHNLYVDPDLSATSRKFSGFMIDFKADKTATNTYWALCNWQMNTDDLKKQYVKVKGGGAYAGLQIRSDGPKAIMSFWDVECDDVYANRTSIRAKRLYPTQEDTNVFGREGTGANYIYDYPWKAGRWYRMYINSYQNNKGRTYVEQWIADLEIGKWTLISRFDTGLYNSYFQGGMSQFMENYNGLSANETRSFEYRNIRVREYESGEWKTIRNATLSVDTWWDNKKGNAVFGATNDRFYGITNGYGSDAFELNQKVRGTFRVMPTENMCIPSTKGANKPTQLLIDGADLSESTLKKIIMFNGVKTVYLKDIKKSKLKKYRQWILETNRDAIIIVE